MLTPTTVATSYSTSIKAHYVQDFSLFVVRSDQVRNPWKRRHHDASRVFVPCEGGVALFNTCVFMTVSLALCTEILVTSIPSREGWKPLGKRLSNIDLVPKTNMASEFSRPLIIIVNVRRFVSSKTFELGSQNSPTIAYPTLCRVLKHRKFNPKVAGA